MTPTDGDRERVLNLLRRYGYQSQSYNTLRSDKSYFFLSRGIDGVIAYVVRARFALAAGDPVCDPSVLREFVLEFREFCKVRGWRCCFQAVTDRCESVLAELGFSTMKIGEEPIFDLNRLSWVGGKFKDLRNDVKSAKKKELSVVEYRPLERRRLDWEEQMEELSRAWMRFKGSHEFSFLIGEPSLNDPGDRKYFLVLKDEQVEGFVVCSPIYARNGIYFDLMRRREEPLRGTAQMLITEAFRLLKEQGYEMATLGTAPLANEHIEDPDQSRIIELAMDLAFNYLDYFYRFKPLYQFKEQFGPTSWEGRYLAFWPSRFNPVILYAILKAYDPSGVSGQLLRQLQMAWRGIKWLGQVPQDLLEKLIGH